MFLLDSNVYIRGFRELPFNEELQNFHRVNMSQMVVSAVVVSELLVGAQSPANERALRRTLVEPFLARRRFLTPGWQAWYRASEIDRGLRRDEGLRLKLAERSFFHDILIAATAREFGATIVTYNTDDFALISREVDIAFVKPWPGNLAA